MTEDVLAPEWRRWVVENLLRGSEVEDLVAVLSRAGVDPALARAAVHAEAEDPCFQGAARAVAMQRKLEGLLDLYGDLHRQSEGHARIDRHAHLSPEDFFERYYFQNLPVVTHSSVGLVPPEAPSGEWRDAPGAARALTPVRRNTLLCQVQGRACLELVPAYALHRVLGADSVPEGVPRLEVELLPGELLLLPVGWWFTHRSPEGGVATVHESFAVPGPDVSWTPRPESREPTPVPLRRPG
ncbi:hypothetical protein SAMN05443572_10727 [Myxococcus fulvus]|uniref:JmjC domain-containing protein n=1 Tax=Myxococcus fulvus TaxID=33 RepID=A0A511TA58_MYXFU|nr:hypothetical protein [Myxococcus fulvus]GEN10068.1 hypothetical protein MFU01_51050 [Myxococcus fulvus]SEU24986.1 hypothetical protein SAMN05443572_10727 [Myxococcus fulvus]